MAIVGQPDPACQHSVYEPVCYQAIVSAPGKEVTLAKICYFIDGVLCVDEDGDPITSEFVPFDGGAGVYGFEFDIRSKIKCFLNPNADGQSDVFGDLCGRYSAPSAMHSVEVQIEIKYYGFDSTVVGAKQEFCDITDLSQTTTIVNAVGDLDDYDLTKGFPFCFFTDRPNCATTNQFESIFLTYNSIFVSGFEVTSYDDQGNVLESGIAPTNPTIGFGEMATFAVGPCDINDPGFFWSSGDVTIDSAVCYYEVTAGLDLGFAYFPLTKPIKFPVKNIDKYCKHHTFYFMNCRGGVDTYTFDGEIRVLDNPTSQSFTQSKTKNTGKEQGGYTRFNIRDNDVTEAVTRELKIECIEWLRQLQSSGEVYCSYIDDEGLPQYEKIFIQDSQSILCESRRSTGKRKITFTKSNCLVKPQI